MTNKSDRSDAKELKGAAQAPLRVPTAEAEAEHMEDDKASLEALSVQNGPPPRDAINQESPSFRVTEGDASVPTELSPARMENLNQGADKAPTEADIATFVDIAQQLEHELCSIVVGQE